MSNIPAWLADITVGQIFAFLVGIGALVAAWRFIAPFVKTVKNFFEDWNGEAGRPNDGVPGRKGIMATLKDHGDQIAEIQSQVTPNHGSDLKLSEELQHLRTEITTLTQGVDETKTKVSDLSLAAKDTQAALSEHLENVPVLIADILEKANENAAEMITTSRVGHLQPTLFGDHR